MRTALVLPTAAVLAGLGGGGVAAASSPPVSVSPPPSITVNGSAAENVAPGGGPAELDSAYDSMLAAALAAAQAKAAFVAGQESLTLGVVENVTENSDVPDPGCDVLAPGVASGAATPVRARRPSTRRRTRVHGKTTARTAQIIATADGCAVQAQVTVTYLISGPGPSTSTSATSSTSTTPSTPTSTVTTTTTATTTTQ